ncbi:MAG TPA: hypothetical protein VM140_13045 [Burkholderiales bacterium]|nr:hypothetical protein [Burkholderiales bacterium]
MRGVILLLATFLAPPAVAQSSLDLGDRRLDAIDDPVQIEFQAGTPPGIDRIGQALEKVGRHRGWRMAPQGAGRWELVNEVAGKHVAKVEALCDAAACTIKYVDSVNLLYRDRKQSGAPLRAIHKNYNTWVHALATGLAAEVGGKTRISYGFAPVAEVEALPFVDVNGQRAYREFLGHPKPRAFAIAPNGAFGWSAPANGGTYNAVRYLDTVENAMRRCGRRGGDACRLYAVDDRVVWDPDR